jgi:hypothetical protein
MRTVLDGGERESSWEKDAQAERPIRLTAALRHLASVPSPPTIAPSRPLPAQLPTLQHHNLSLSLSFAGSLLLIFLSYSSLSPWLALWALYMEQDGQRCQ